jgi:hypothetical protein
VIPTDLSKVSQLACVPLEFNPMLPAPPPGCTCILNLRTSKSWTRNSHHFLSLPLLTLLCFSLKAHTQQGWVAPLWAIELSVAGRGWSFRGQGHWEITGVLTLAYTRLHAPTLGPGRWCLIACRLFLSRVHITATWGALSTFWSPDHLRQNL